MAHLSKNRWRRVIWRNKIIIVIILIILCLISDQIYLNSLVIDKPDVPYKPIIDQQSITLNKNTNTNPLQKHIEQRTKPTHTHCPNPYLEHYNTARPKYQRLDISKLPSNWLYFANRCQMNEKKFTHNAHGDFDKMWMNSKIGYLHNYKCGGSSIQLALEKLSKIDLKGDYLYNDSRRNDVNLFVSSKAFMNESGWHTNPHKWYKILTDMFLFTFVRDPIDKFLSSFYEVHTRNHSAKRIWSRLHVSQYSGITRLRKLLQLFGANMDEMRNGVIGNEKHHIDIGSLWKGERHFHPQMLFLWNVEFKFLPFDYIGDINELDNALKIILDEFSDYFHANPDKYETFVRHLRQRQVEDTINKDKFRKKRNYAHAKDNAYYITRDELDDDDIKAICEAYWVDYICLPFDIPKQCNAEQLFAKYFNRFVAYNDCYFS